MKGQTVIGQLCAWCGESAEGRVEVAPPRKEKGEWHDGVRVPACGHHMQSVQVGEPMGMPMRRKAKGVKQLSLGDAA